MKLPERFWNKVAKTPSCWLWTGAKGRGYGLFAFDGRLQPAHRLAYEELVGPIPEGLEIDHLCRVRACVNPAHLEPVTPRENQHRSNSVSGVNARKTHCKRGHPLSGSNVYRKPGRPHERVCRACKPLDLREWRARQRGAA